VIFLFPAAILLSCSIGGSKSDFFDSTPNLVGQQINVKYAVKT